MAPHVALIDPLSIIDGREVTFLRDNFGGEVPLSCPYPPLDLASTAAVLRDKTISVELIAANVLGLRHQQVAAQLATTSPTHVLVPSAWGSLRDDFLLMKILRDTLPDTKLVMSGPNVTAEPGKPLL